MAGVEWIKVSTDMFDRSRKIKQIELMPKGDTYLIIWWKLLLLAGTINDGGKIYVTPAIPYTVESLASELRRPVNTVRAALDIFEQYGMVERNGDALSLPSWGKYQNIDGMEKLKEQNRKRQAKYQSRQKAARESNVTDNGSNNVSITLYNETEEEREEEIRIRDRMNVCNTNTITGGNADSFNHSFTPDIVNSNSASPGHTARERMGGELGGGVVFLSEAQKNDLLDKLSIDEFDYYIGIVRDQELKGNHYKSKSHYQAILDMVKKDRGTQ